MMFTQFLKALSLLSLLLAPFTIGQNTSECEFNKRRTLSIGIVMFDGFEPIEVWGQLEYLTSLSAFYKMTLSIISYQKGTVTVTHTFADAPALDVILVPCGMGVINATLSNRTEIEEFLVRRVDQAEYILGLSFGVTHLARPGLLNAKRATTSKSGYQWIVNYGPGVKWVPQARWVVDGKFWTASGMMASLDMTYAWLSHVYGAEGAVNQQTNGIEYAPHLDSSWDPYAIVFNVPGANASRPCQDCVGPIGT
ncbi:class I glutamine amidotransferase-like protein [Bipolaris maydis]|uniref:class I glutamine amidotransferase-like protein n=1 Tax=Cochliobolus heterostrophus TaxID=5016 RepID=UPI0024D1B665|nr:class I glutamine amidotransferase-like protein [Bipolaris maydis]